MAKKLEHSTLPVDKLIAYALNSRVHSEKQVDQVAASIQEFGFTAPVVVRESDKGIYTILAGHCRIMAAKKLGLKEVPAIIANGWSDAQAKAYVIADNKLALNATWDFEILKAEMEAITEEGLAMEITGFDMDEFKALTGDWTAEATKTDKTQASGDKARGKLTVSFDEVDREEVREAITNAIDSLSVDNVEVS